MKRKGKKKSVYLGGEKRPVSNRSRIRVQSLALRGGTIVITIIIIKKRTREVEPASVTFPLVGPLVRRSSFVFDRATKRRKRESRFLGSPSSSRASRGA